MAKSKSKIVMGKPLRIDEDAGLAKPKKKASDYDKMASREQDTINKGKSSVIRSIDQEGMIKAKKKKVRF